MWLVPPDTLRLWESSEEVEVEIFNDRGDTLQSSNSPFFPEEFNGQDAYNLYFQGNHSFVHITNKKGTQNKLLMIKDSYANAFSAFLSYNYGEIFMVDLRYFRQQNLGDFARRNGITNILFLYSIPQLLTDENFFWLKG